MTTKLMRARFAGHCHGCHQGIARGDDIIYDSSIKRAFHPDCHTPAPDKGAHQPSCDRFDMEQEDAMACACGLM